MFCDGELQRSVRITHGSENFSFCCYVTPIIIIITSLPIHLQHTELMVRSIRPTEFLEIPVQNRVEQKVSGNSF